MTRTEDRLSWRERTDTTLDLTHNLDAAAIGGLSAEVAEIEADAGALIAEMRSFIAEAERFVPTMPDQRPWGSAVETTGYNRLP